MGKVEKKRNEKREIKKINRTEMFYEIIIFCFRKWWEESQNSQRPAANKLKSKLRDLKIDPGSVVSLANTCATLS